MYAFPPLLVLIFSLFIVVLVMLLPVKMAAAAMSAKRTGFIWCFLALLGASFVEGLGLSVPVYGTLVSFLLSAAVFAGFLGTDYLRGIGIAILHILFSILILFIFAALCGIGLSAFLVI